VAIIVVIIALIIAVAVHELGHALAMRSRGVDIEECGLGWPIGSLPCLFQCQLPGKYSRTTFKVHLFLLGAYVKPTTYGLILKERLPLKDKAIIMGAGVLANIMLSLFLNMVLTMKSGSIAGVGVYIFLLALVWLGRVWFSRFLVPLAGLFVMYLLISGILQAPTESVAGPVGIVDIVGKSIGELSLWTFINTVSFISFCLGSMNVLPLPPLDGGVIVNDLIGKYSEKFQKYHQSFGSLAFISLLILALSSDCLRIFK